MSATRAISALLLVGIFLLSAAAASPGHTAATRGLPGVGPSWAVAPARAPAPYVVGPAESHNVSGPARWFNITGLTTAGPVGRNRVGLAPDPTLGGLLMFGGYNPPTFQQFFNDTWLLRGGVWTQLHPPTAPSPRATIQMAWDSSDSVDLTFGGHPQFVYPNDLDDTWTFSGTGNGDWTQHATPAGLTLREGYALCDDPADHGVILFGGDSGASGASGQNDTWLYAAGNWTQLHPAHAPSARTDMTCVWDAALHEDVLFGGETGEAPSTELNDTWAFKGGDWSLVTTSGPGPRVPNSLAETSTGSLVTFSGGCPTGDCGNDTWQFANGAWSRILHGGTPTDRSWTGLAYDPSTNATYMFGGSLGTPYSGWTNETFEFATPTIDAQASINTIDLGAPAVGDVQTGPAAAGGYVTVRWGDGSSPAILAGGSAFFAATHDYGATGTYNATFNWTDSGGQTLGTNLTYHVDPLPSVTVSATPSSGTTLPLSVAITASVNGGVGPYSFSWLAGDGTSTQTKANSGSSLSASHSYTTNGTFEIHLTVTDADAKSATATTNVTVTNTSTPPTPHNPPPSNPTSSGSGGATPLPWLVWGILAAVIAVAALAGVAVGRGGRNR